MANPTAKQIWDKLSKIDVNKHTEKRGKLTYLSWAWAWGIMMDNYPDLTVKWQGKLDENGVMRDVNIYPDGTATVNCTVTIGDVTREMWLPVMDYMHKAIVSPDARKISDTKMRCFTKCFAMFGLGHYIYAGEDVPEQEEVVPVQQATANGVTKPKKKSSPKKPVQKNTEASDDVDEKIVILKKTINSLAKGGWDIKDEKLQREIKKAITDRDESKVTALTNNIQTLGQSALQLSEDS